MRGFRDGIGKPWRVRHGSLEETVGDERVVTDPARGGTLVGRAAGGGPVLEPFTGRKGVDVTRVIAAASHTCHCRAVEFLKL
ncbi:hypothetical protein MGAD_21760 [Mycolicibacterium gadium]|uniref:Uncharacterized protein n=1 Tax=Mycolicibacterium gadium TaxID=1794 RepID=A0A7I7WMR8_MYCGU|nr:hypothetical protein MGAD_21760 [Mycolicibacterium gadium]